MKKKFLIIFLLILTITMTIIAPAYAYKPEPDIIVGESMIYRYPEYHNIFPSIFTYDNYPTLKIEEYYSKQWMVTAIRLRYESMVSVIPRHLLQKLKKANVVVHVVHSSADYYGSKNAPMFLDGLYWSNSNRIFITGYDVPTKKMEDSLYHEIGHAIDKLYGWKSESSEFRKIYKVENSATAMQWRRDDSCEFFAEHFQACMWAYYCGNDDWAINLLSEKTPLVLEYFDNKFSLSFNTFTYKLKSIQAKIMEKQQILGKVEFSAFCEYKEIMALYEWRISNISQ